MAALVACGKTILLQLNVLFKKCNGEKENNRPRGAIKISPPSYFLHSEIFSSSSSGPLPAGNSIAERHSSNVPRNQRAERGVYPFSASSSATPHCRHRVSDSVAGACPWRDPATQGQCSEGMRRGHDSSLRLPTSFTSRFFGRNSKKASRNIEGRRNKCGNHARRSASGPTIHFV